MRSLLCLAVAIALLASLVGIASAQGAAAARRSSAGLGEARPVAASGRVKTSPRLTRAHWTRSRLAAAKPLQPILAGSSSSTADTNTGIEESVTPSELAGTRPHQDRATTSSVAGTQLSGTSYPESTQGALFGAFDHNGHEEDFLCSGSVISSTAGNLLLTAGHCVIDPETGAVASWLAFVPDYHEGQEPLGVWAATEYGVTKAWSEGAERGTSDESGDVAILRLQNRESDGATIESVVGSLGIAFGQPRDQLYTQYGYPGASPYDGEHLYRETAEYQGSDNSFSPATIGVSSDFTQGSSGGPWTTGGSNPVVVSLTTYSYEKDSGVLFGPYFGGEVKALYRKAAGEPEAEGITDVSLRLTAFRRDPETGTARVSVAVPAAGTVRLVGTGVAGSTETVKGARTVTFEVTPTGSSAARLRRTGRTTVSFRLTYRNGAGLGGTVRRTFTVAEADR